MRNKIKVRLNDGRRAVIRAIYVHKIFLIAFLKTAAWPSFAADPH